MVLLSAVKAYCVPDDLLLQVSRLDALGPADNSQLDALRGWLQDPKGGAHGPKGRTFLQKSEARLWEQEEGSTFISVGPTQGEKDIFTKVISWILLSVVHKYLGFWRIAGRPIDAEAGMYSYSDSQLLRTGTLVATVLSSTIPVLSIFVLFIVKNTYGRIGIAAGFTAVFSAVLAAFSSARRVEIFAATATFAAVEVVFIGSALNTGS
ncbi:hypothetical protein AYO22_07234 [Fonsecaea multimorphosa]|nr:hypothetical protein AYO22_07234 [Fonsecaea multimorphosa]